MNFEELINTATDVGYMLLANGAEIYRVEESMQRIFLSYSVETGEVFVIPTCIYVALSNSEGSPITRIKRVYERCTNVGKVERVNDLCRCICHEKPDFQVIRRELQKIDLRPNYSFLQQTVAVSLIAFSFTLFYGGKIADAFCAII